MTDTGKETSIDRAVTVDKDGHILLIGLHRPAKRNAFTMQMINELAEAYGRLESDDDLWCGVLYAHGDHFTAGLDLMDVGPALAGGSLTVPDGARDPWRLDGTWSTPVIAAASGWVMTLGIELLLAADMAVVARDTRFAQLEVRRGIYPFGGATLRFPRVAGWGNAMRWMLTGDEFDAEQAYRMGLVQQIADDRQGAFDAALALARTITEKSAPLGVRATVSSATTALVEGDEAAIPRLHPAIAELFTTADCAEGLQSFAERRDARFTGR